MPLTKARKEELVNEYVELIEQSRALIFTEYRGLTNKQLTGLRRSVREADGVLRVTKLTLLSRALEQAGLPVPQELLGKPVAVGFCLQEIPGVAKALTDFAAESDVFVVHGGLSGGELRTASQIKALADLPPLDVLRAQLLGLFDAPASNLVGVIQAGVASVVNVLNAYVDAGEGGEAAAAS